MSCGGLQQAGLSTAHGPTAASAPPTDRLSHRGPAVKRPKHVPGGCQLNVKQVGPNLIAVRIHVRLRACHWQVLYALAHSQQLGRQLRGPVVAVAQS